MDYVPLLIALLALGVVWMAALALGIVLFYSNLKKYNTEGEKPFQGNYFRKLIIICIVLPAVITAAVVLFFVFSPPVR